MGSPRVWPERPHFPAHPWHPNGLPTGDPCTCRSTSEGGVSMQYLLLMYSDETWDQLSVTERQQIYEEQ
jgi:hypothetical protein